MQQVYVVIFTKRIVYDRKISQLGYPYHLTGLVSEMYTESQHIGHFFHLAFFSGIGLESLVECIYRIRQGKQKICPHLAIRGATGVDRQIGQLVDWD